MSIRIPTELSDSDLTDAIGRLVGSERHAAARLVAHLAEFDARRLHLAEGYPSLFAYCREVCICRNPRRPTASSPRGLRADSRRRSGCSSLRR
jgi:hypothetical protein